MRVQRRFVTSLLVGLFAARLARGEEMPLEDAGPPALLIIPDQQVGRELGVAFARKVSVRTGLASKSTLPAPIDAARRNASGQIVCNDLLTLIEPTANRLRRQYDAPDALALLLIGPDMNDASSAFRYMFSFHDAVSRISVVSLARLTLGADGRATNGKLFDRAFKLIMRAVAEQVYHRPRSLDPKSLMYAPLMGLDDLDAIGDVLPPA